MHQGAEMEEAPLTDGTSLQIVETGIPYLDVLLGGGLPRGAIAMVVGAPGTGKTTLAQQMAFHAASQGAATLYLTGYSETHAKLLAYGRGFRFFAPEHIGTLIHYLSLADLLARGADETEQSIVHTAREQRARLVVLDGYRSMRRLLGDEPASTDFLYSLGSKLALLGVTTIVAAEGDAHAPERYGELTVSDTVIGLTRRRHGERHRRTLDVVKIRGMAPIAGLHAFEITRAGFDIYPRLEATVPRGDAAPTGRRAVFGISELDVMVGGGLPGGTSALVAGAPGVGKTLLGLHFLMAGARQGEPGLLVGFIEDRPRLREKALAFGMDLEAEERAGRIHLLTIPSFELDPDRVACLLREDIERRAVQRVVIDSVAELDRSFLERVRAPDYFAALAHYLRSQGVTGYLTMDIPKVVGQELDLTDSALAMLAENLILLRYVEYRGRLQRLLSVLKMRSSGHDDTIRTYEIAEGLGLRLLGEAPPVRGLLTGIPHELDVAESRTRRRRTRGGPPS
jgi:circadian clock protein KaiC